MSFKVKDLAVSVADLDDASTCTGWTKPTTGGSCGVSAFGWRDGAGARGHNLSALKAQLRQAMARA